MSHTAMLQSHVAYRCPAAFGQHRNAHATSRSAPARSFKTLPTYTFGCGSSFERRCDVRVQVFNFKFGQNPENSLVILRNAREDFSTEDVEDYFNYMGMLAVEGTYDKMYAMLNSGLAPPEILLLWACSENDLPKVQELLAAGALVDVQNLEGKRPEELASKPEILSLLQEYGLKQRATV